MTAVDSQVMSLELDTESGSARVHLHSPATPAGLALVLGHGAGGGVEAPDLTAARRAALAEGLSVALVEQPYRVAGRRSPAPQRQLDAAWLAVIGALRADALAGRDLIVGGRSSGARVACRTAAAAGAVAVLCLAFPLQPPGRRNGPAPTRLPELDLVNVPTLVIQGANDAFGRPPGAPQRTVTVVPGDHSLRRDAAQIEAVFRPWLRERVRELAG